MPAPGFIVTRRRSAETTRAAILEAARCRFSREGYEGAGVRDIAGDAGVDAALVSRYFGGKDELFAAVLELSAKPDELFYGAPEEFAARIAALLVRDPQDDAKMDCVLIMLRSASSPKAAAAIRQFIEARFYGPMVEWLGCADATVLSRLLGALMMGMGVTRAISPDLDLDAAGREALERKVEAILLAMLRPNQPVG
ncbi:TetR/AcrR family transcriptional regulator [Phenylobacterium sp.]|uniref:TetR/AcrR family transcriptional regulator n=1 Tax=Phenylobacterium sp. TaxID=1871053 RepID=UPI002736EFF8|nr:TetR/AcrR family transcriptional regulator [Phenylobacterium sp.]MDP3660361.1 TetR family transcriptional regulator [Phenylobacterium sp.]